MQNIGRFFLFIDDVDSFETADFTRSVLEARGYYPYINNHPILSDRSPKIAFTFMNSSSQDSKASLVLNVERVAFIAFRVKELQT